MIRKNEAEEWGGNGGTAVMDGGGYGGKAVTAGGFLWNSSEVSGQLDRSILIWMRGGMRCMQRGLYAALRCFGARRM